MKSNSLKVSAHETNVSSLMGAGGQWLVEWDRVSRRELYRITESRRDYDAQTLARAQQELGRR